jgi:hypothetical protein
VSQIKKLFLHGFRDYLLSWDNICSCIMAILYSTCYGLKFYTVYRVNLETSKISEHSFWSEVKNIDENDIESQKQIYQTFYWLNQGLLLFSSSFFKDNDFLRNAVSIIFMARSLLLVFTRSDQSIRGIICNSRHNKLC